MFPDMPKPISITVRYDAALQQVTRTPEEPVIMSSGSSFGYLLMNIFMAHPEMQAKHPPGALGFKVNSIPPELHSPLFDGDVVNFQATSAESVEE